MNIHQQFASYWEDDTLYPFAYWAHKSLQDGNICFDMDAIHSIDDLKPYPMDSNRVKASPLVSNDPSDIKPFIIQNNKFYCYKYFNYESRFLETIQRFQKISDDKQKERYQLIEKLTIDASLYDQDLETISLQPNPVDWQFVGAINGYIQQFSILTGGPGTGKTTTITKLLYIIQQEQPDLKIAMTAQTGKAAARMKETLSANGIYQKLLMDKITPPISSTIHRLLGYIPNSHHFKHNTSNPLDYDVIIVDEASMIDVPLFTKLMEAIDENRTRVIILGDQNQLSSIEAGSLLKDLCESIKSNEYKTVNQFSKEFIDLVNQKLSTYPINMQYLNSNPKNPLTGKITGLEISRRFTSDSQIGLLSAAVLEEDLDGVLKFKQGDHQTTANDFAAIHSNYDEIDLNRMIGLYEDYINEADIKIALEKLNNVRVLCAVRNGKYGVYHYNALIETALKSKKLIRTDQVLYHNRPILITKNTPELELYNGDIGIIRVENGIPKAYFLMDNEIKEVAAALLNDLETVYAMTIHKSQGSEFNHVLMVLPQNESKILTKELIYTGITRAKKEIIVHATDQVFTDGINRKINRVSGIVERLNQN